MLGNMDYSTPEPQQGRSGQLMTEADSLPNQQLHDTSDAYQQQTQELPPATKQGAQAWPVSGDQQPESDYNNVAASMAIHLVPMLLRGKNMSTDQINAPYGSNMRYQTQ